MNAACQNKNVKCLALLVQHGGSLRKVSTFHKESAIDSARKTRHKKLIEFINDLRNTEDFTDDGFDSLESTAEDRQKVNFSIINSYM